MDDFLIVYHLNDHQYAQQIHDWLIDSDFKAIIGKPCFEDGQTFEDTVLGAPQQALRILAVFSPTFIAQLTKEESWQKSLTKKPGREFHFVIPVLIEPYDLSLLDIQKVYIDLSDLDIENAKTPFLFALRKFINSSSESDLIRTFM